VSVPQGHQAVEASPVAGSVLAGRYRLEELLGMGGMSNVFAATDRVLERRVAVKVLHRRLVGEGGHVNRFLREAHTAAALSHEHVVAVIDRGETGGVPFIVFELVPGENLKELMRREGPLPVDRALEIAIAVARGLAFAHAHGVVHRDVKPQNVVLTAGGVPKVTDFGIARALAADGTTLTETGTVLGSADYIAPEQAQSLETGEAGDVYSLGVVLYELLTGELPFTGPGFVSVAMKHVNEPPPRVRSRRRDVPPCVDTAVAKALAKDPHDRFTSMAAFAHELDLCRGELGTGSGAHTLVLPEAQPRRPRRRQRRGAPVAAAAVLAASVAALAFVLVADQADGPQPPPARANPPAHVPATGPIALHAVAAYDPPPGDGVEDNARLGAATDGDPASWWRTEQYASEQFGNLKQGVGIVLDAGAAHPSELTIHTDTPGFTAVVKAGPAESGPFTAVSGGRQVGAATTFHLSGVGGSRFLLIWITRLSPSTGPRFYADINEVTAKGN
jgi:serine/threonine-protein kinase